MYLHNAVISEFILLAQEVSGGEQFSQARTFKYYLSPKVVFFP